MLLQQGSPIAFVGAGASAGLYPLWPQLIEVLADLTVSEGLAEPRDAERWKSDRNSTPQQKVNTIIRKLGEDRYRRFLKETFKPRPERFTEAHAALLRMPFRGYVTTNYDPGLEFARMRERPDCLTTGTPTWQDDDEVHSWLTGDILKEPDSCPILWLHGFWQRPNSIVLNAGEYAQAYKQGLYRRTFERLWLQDRLVFLGFGFNDPSFTFMVSEMLRDISHTHAAPRHIAILSVDCEPGTQPDSVEIRERRDGLEADYHVRPIFYPAYGRDHTALQHLLGILAEPFVVPTPSVVLPLASRAEIQVKWVHETSDDERFTGREEEIDRLNRWVADSSVAVIGVSAVGGTGKTALLGHWLKKTSDWKSRPFVGLFAWSFYQNPSAVAFMEGLIEWSQEALRVLKPGQKLKLASAALSILKSKPMLIVLDGLEVVQEGQDGERFGQFLDWNLRELLSGLCEGRCDSIAVLTSRFTFADLERFLGTTFRQLELPGLPKESGANLLHEMGLVGATEERISVSERLDGHPLLLRIFAESFLDDPTDSPLRFLDDAFSPDHVPSDATLNDKMQRLLTFYDGTLSDAQRRVLSIVSLFRRPVTEEVIVSLSSGLFEDQDGLPANLAALARRLLTRGILTTEQVGNSYGYACHPILRDHFRSAFLSGRDGQGKRAADLIAGEPSNNSPRTIEEIEPVLLAIEILLDADEFGAADDLYRNRLENGWIFLGLPALADGVRCASKFLGARALQENAQRLSFFHNDIGLFASDAGMSAVANDHLSKAREIDRQDTKNQCVTLLNIGELHCRTGRLFSAGESLREALVLAYEMSHMEEASDIQAYMGWTYFLSGRCKDAAFCFATASRVWRHFNDGDDLFSRTAIYRAEFLARSGRLDAAEIFTQSNLLHCQEGRWNDDVALCRWILGIYNLEHGFFDQSGVELDAAEETYERGQMVFELARLHVTAGYLSIARGEREGALSRSKRALDLAAPRGLRLVHSDALILRGRARMLRPSPDDALRALDDAESALKIARDCGYPWAERDALLLQAEALELWARTGADGSNGNDARRAIQRAERLRLEGLSIAAKLVLTDQDFAGADEAAHDELKRVLEGQESVDDE